MFPINVSLFPAHLEKHCCGNKICFPGTKNVSQQNIFVAETMFPSLPSSFQMFPTQGTLFSRLGMFKQCLKTYNTLRFARANVSQKIFTSLPTEGNMTKHR